MSTRALSRTGQPAAPLIELPTDFHPQYVNKGGYEHTQEDIAALHQASSNTDENEGLPDVSPLKDDAEPDMEANDLDGSGGHQTEKSLLSLADSLVLPYSLTLTRQHHLTHLLPHIFSHPIVPVHSRPRIRGPPKSAFLFPTPPPPTQPLPNKEYHDAPKSATSSTPTELPKKTSKSISGDKEEPPAHQTECIARITLSIGPISYPGTEIWVGQFVEPRIAPLMKEKTNKAPRHSLNDTAAARRATLSNTSQASPIPREGATPRSSLVPPPRSTLPTTLIQRVNAAATQHPWLSVIIHKAAHSNASKEELARLGRVVARINRGEVIGEGGDARTFTNAAGTATSAAAQAGPSRTSLEASSTLVVDDSSDSDADADMTGARQVGGGTVPPERQSTPRTHAQSVISTPDRPTPNEVIHPALSSPSASLVVPRTPHARPPPSKTQGAGTPVPPPRTIHPPPFLLVALREAPTEKYLVPLGSQSFVSRIGGDYVTGPPTVGRKVEVPPLAARPSVPNTVASSILSQAPEVHSIPLFKPGAGRTRAALRGTKPETATGLAAGPAIAADSNTVLEGTAKMSHRNPPDLSPLSNMEPLPGNVLLSIVVPAGEWMRPNWTELEKSLPFRKPGFGNPQAEVENVHAMPVLSSGDDAAKSSPNISLRQEYPAFEVAPSKQRTSVPLNLAATSFIPTEGDVHPVTIGLGDIDDRAWRRIKYVMDEVERMEMVALGATHPAMLRAESASPIGGPSKSSGPKSSTPTAHGTPPVPRFSAPLDRKSTRLNSSH
ncbi:MAG: hypothetical protein TREMPRED_004786, partial [Tremellales sp. Tagirdzhanova-0007]